MCCINEFRISIAMMLKFSRGGYLHLNIALNKNIPSQSYKCIIYIRYRLSVTYVSVSGIRTF